MVESTIAHCNNDVIKLIPKWFYSNNRPLTMANIFVARKFSTVCVGCWRAINPKYFWHFRLIYAHRPPNVVIAINSEYRYVLAFILCWSPKRVRGSVYSFLRGSLVAWWWWILTGHGIYLEIHCTRPTYHFLQIIRQKSYVDKTRMHSSLSRATEITHNSRRITPYTYIIWRPLAFYIAYVRIERLRRDKEYPETAHCPPGHERQIAVKVIRIWR